MTNTMCTNCPTVIPVGAYTTPNGQCYPCALENIGSAEPHRAGFTFTASDIDIDAVVDALADHAENGCGGECALCAFADDECPECGDSIHDMPADEVGLHTLGGDAVVRACEGFVTPVAFMVSHTLDERAEAAAGERAERSCTGGR